MGRDQKFVGTLKPAASPSHNTTNDELMSAFYLSLIIRRNQHQRPNL